MKDTKIEWADHSWSPWIGCAKVSPGCANCYAEHLMDKRMKRVNWGAGNPRKRTSAKYWAEPVRWNRNLECLARCTGCGRSGPASSWDEDVAKEGGPAAAACCPDNSRIPEYATVFPSLCDWLDPEVPIEWLADFMSLIRRTPNLRWLLLTKRPQLFYQRMTNAGRFLNGTESKTPIDTETADWIEGWIQGQPPSNVALGVSAEDQERWDWRVPALLQIPAHWRFVSVEPMLGPINLQFARRASMRLDDHSRQLHASIDQVIFGGESGPGARPCHIDWVRDGVRQCREAGVKAFVKQDSGARAGIQGRIPVDLWAVNETL